MQKLWNIFANNYFLLFISFYFVYIYIEINDLIYLMTQINRPEMKQNTHLYKN